MDGDGESVVEMTPYPGYSKRRLENKSLHKW